MVRGHLRALWGRPDKVGVGQGRLVVAVLAHQSRSWSRGSRGGGGGNCAQYWVTLMRRSPIWWLNYFLLIE